MQAPLEESGAMDSIKLVVPTDFKRNEAWTLVLSLGKQIYRVNTDLTKRIQISL
jgi:hypothetical protein